MVTLAQTTPLDSNYPKKKPDDILYHRVGTMTSGEHLPNKVTEVPKEVLRNFPHSKRVGNYLLGRTLGEGSFAKVKEGMHTLTGEKVSSNSSLLNRHLLSMVSLVSGNWVSLIHPKLKQTITF
jgi:hypothetical protein